MSTSEVLFLAHEYPDTSHAERMTIDKSGNGCGSSRPEVRRRKTPSRLSSLKNKRRNFK